jgi:hypothetical protein
MLDALAKTVTSRWRMIFPIEIRQIMQAGCLLLCCLPAWSGEPLHAVHRHRAQCEKVYCNACQQVQRGPIGCAVCMPRPDSPVLVPPLPSIGPEITLDDRNTPENIWGRNIAAYKLTAICSSICQNGAEKIALSGDIIPEGYTIVVHALVRSPTCGSRFRSEHHVCRTILHELVHRRFFMTLINQGKAQTGKVFDNMDSCLAASRLWSDRFHADFDAMRERQEAHIDFVGEPQYGQICVGGSAEEVFSGVY